MKQVFKTFLSALLCVSLVFGGVPTAYADVIAYQGEVVLDSTHREDDVVISDESPTILDDKTEEVSDETVIAPEEAFEDSSNEADRASDEVQEASDDTAVISDEAAGIEYEEGEVIVVFNDEVDVENAVGTFEEVEGVDEDSVDESSLLADDMVIVELDESTTVAQAVEELNERPDVAYAQPNYIYHVAEEDTEGFSYDPLGKTVINDPRAASEQWSLDATKLYDTWTLARADKEKVGVAIIDTGVMETHADLKNMIPAGASYNATTKTVGASGDPNGHGTHVAGIVAAETNNGLGVSGVSYNAQIIPIRVLSDSGSMNTRYMVQGYTHLFESAGNGQTVAEKYNVKVINISLGSTGQDTTLFKWIDKAYDAGILTVCSSGNESPSQGFYQFDLIYPAAYETCVSVGNVYQRSSATEFDCLIAGGSIANEQVDVSAPGTNILSTYRTGGYTSLSGTSMASPYVAGVSALLFAVDPDASPYSVRNALEKTAVDKGGSGWEAYGSGWDIYYGHGIVNPYQAVKTMSETKINHGTVGSVGTPVQCSVVTTLTEPSASDWTWSVEGSSSSFASINAAGVLVATDAGVVKVKASYIEDTSVYATADIVVGVRVELSSKNCAYTGSAITPTVKVYRDGKLLVLNTDYSLSYSNNVNVGKRALVKITGLKGFKGVINEYFTIYDSVKPTISQATPKGTDVALSGTIRLAFSEEMKKDAVGTITLVPNTGSNVKIASGTWKSGTVYEAKYAHLEGKIKYTIKVSGFKDVNGNTMVESSSNYFITKQVRYTITKNYVGGAFGSVTVIASSDGSPATLYPQAGATVTFRTSPQVGYTLTRMSYTTASGKTVALKRIEGTGRAGTNSVYSFMMPAENVTLNATFGVNTRTIHKEISGQGQLMIVANSDGSKGTLYPQVGNRVTFKAIPSSGYKLTKINYVPETTGTPLALSKVAGASSTYTFIMPNSDVTLNGVFVKK